MPGAGSLGYISCPSENLALTAALSTFRQSDSIDRRAWECLSSPPRYGEVSTVFLHEPLRQFSPAADRGPVTFSLWAIIYPTPPPHLTLPLKEVLLSHSWKPRPSRCGSPRSHNKESDQNPGIRLPGSYGAKSTQCVLRPLFVMHALLSCCWEVIFIGKA